MLRTVGRVASILLVTGIVSGGLYLLVTMSQTGAMWRDVGPGDRRETGLERTNRGGQADTSTREGAAQGSRESAREGQGRRSRGREDGRWRRNGEGGTTGGFAGRDEGRDGREGRGGHGEFSLARGSAGVVGTTLQVGFVAALVVGMQRYSRRKRSAPGRTEHPA